MLVENNNTNSNNAFGSNINSNSNIDCLRILAQLMGQNSGNLNNSNFNSRNSSHFVPNSNSNIEQDFVRTSNLISELINLEQQNKIQIELIQKIIETKYKNTMYVNNFLVHLLKNSSETGEKIELETTAKSSSRSNEVKVDKNGTFKNADAEKETNLQQKPTGKFNKRFFS